MTSGCYPIGCQPQTSTSILCLIVLQLPDCYIDYNIDYNMTATYISRRNIKYKSNIHCKWCQDNKSFMLLHICAFPRENEIYFPFWRTSLVYCFRQNHAYPNSHNFIVFWWFQYREFLLIVPSYFLPWVLRNHAILSKSVIIFLEIMGFQVEALLLLLEIMRFWMKTIIFLEIMRLQKKALLSFLEIMEF